MRKQRCRGNRARKNHLVSKVDLVRFTRRYVFLDLLEFSVVFSFRYSERELFWNGDVVRNRAAFLRGNWPRPHKRALSVIKNKRHAVNTQPYQRVCILGRPELRDVLKKPA